MQTNYKNFDGKYKQLREENHGGWGGELLEQRVEGWRKTLAFLLTHPRFPKPPARLLEMGCGAGNISELFTQAGYELTGFDISPTAIEWAKERYRENSLQARFFAANATDLSELAAETFDAVIDGNLLHCIVGGDRATVLKEAHRLLRPGGVYFVSTMIGDPKREEDLKNFDRATRCEIREGLAVRHMAAPAGLRDELSFAGFEILWEQTHEHEWWDHMNVLAIAAAQRVFRIFR